jgi:hypothetical protein
MFGLVLKKINLKLHFHKLIVLSRFCNPSNSLDYQEIPYLIKFCNFKSINSRCGLWIIQHENPTPAAAYPVYVTNLFKDMIPLM